MRQRVDVSGRQREDQDDPTAPALVRPYALRDCPTIQMQALAAADARWLRDMQKHLRAWGHRRR